MIGGVTKQLDGGSETFRMSTRAMMAIEDQLGAGISEVLDGFEKGFTIGKLALILAECANDGAGRDTAFAQHAIDALGLEGAGDLLGQIAEAAFPEAKGKSEKATKNGKGASRSK